MAILFSQKKVFSEKWGSGEMRQGWFVRSGQGLMELPGSGCGSGRVAHGLRKECKGDRALLGRVSTSLSPSGGGREGPRPADSRNPPFFTLILVLSLEGEEMFREGEEC